MLNAIRRALGLNYSEATQDESNVEQQHSEVKPLKTLYHGQPVPIDATRDPQDAHTYAEFFETYRVVPAKDGKSVIVFHVDFISESSTGGPPNLDPDAPERPSGRSNPRGHVELTIKIYERLFADGATHRNVVQYLGPTSSGYRLERLSPGPLPGRLPLPSTSDVILALYQRWALQLLAALDFIHSRGIVLSADLGILSQALWLRDDMSIEVAGMVSAGCADLDIVTDFWETCANRWNVKSPRTTVPPFTANETGYYESDIADWAAFVYQLMSGGGTPILGGDSETFRNSDGAELDKREWAAWTGTFDDWPKLSQHFLGPQLIRAWKGEYKSASDALQDVVQALRNCGRQLSKSPHVDILGFDWATEVEVVVNEEYHVNEWLRLRSNKEA